MVIPRSFHSFDLLLSSRLHPIRHHVQLHHHCVLFNGTNLAQRMHQHRLGVDFNHRIICGTAVSSMPPSSDSILIVSHRCCVCHLSILSNNNLYRHVRARCYPLERRQQIKTLSCHLHDSSPHTDPKYSLETCKTFRLDQAIDTGNHRPVCTALYRRCQTDEAVLDIQVAISLREQRTEPSTLPRCSLVVLDREKDGNAHFCVVYRQLNSIT
jgi:hypothetical protein